ncbi:hypothetical protein K402DRAFT_396894 [Aulographum hederae CBS 113979]|uniref:Uncharacterized protein n=1 Tax=Aulographum hederae CBS 113979 TaxID=1176131 RepID=A0A6G1GQU7_9PEZI|nr:hypothetical protein K402DRAFT_396894 [Aulographum hederae CBS 113979]
MLASIRRRLLKAPDSSLFEHMSCLPSLFSSRISVLGPRSTLSRSSIVFETTASTLKSIVQLSFFCGRIPTKMCLKSRLNPPHRTGNCSPQHMGSAAQQTSQTQASPVPTFRERKTHRRAQVRRFAKKLSVNIIVSTCRVFSGLMRGWKLELTIL